MGCVFELKNVTVKYGSKIGIENFNLSLEKGKIVGLLGPNASGKTTLIKTAMMMLPVDSGEVLIDGMPLSEQTKRVTSYLPDTTFFDEDIKVSEGLRLFKDYFGDFDSEKAESMLKDLEVERDKKLKEMTKGMKKRMELALIMSRDARLYLLDEPLNGIDPNSRQYILESIIGNYNPDSTVLIATHLIADVEKVLDEVIFIRDGRLIIHEDADSLRERKNLSIEEYFKEVYQ